jgi:phosphatidylserine/phosphatidylglycerophosphate/cardiolipin synthase-like enzyme
MQIGLSIIHHVRAISNRWNVPLGSALSFNSDWGESFATRDRSVVRACRFRIAGLVRSNALPIRAQAYSFTSAPIARALLSAHKRGVKLVAVLDKSQRSKTYATFLVNNGIPTFIDAKHAIAHNKIMTIDRETIITGSFNFTKSAEKRNAENLLVIKSKKLAGIYLMNWQHHMDTQRLTRG